MLPTLRSRANRSEADKQADRSAQLLFTCLFLLAIIGIALCLWLPPSGQGKVKAKPVARKTFILQSERTKMQRTKAANEWLEIEASSHEK